MRIYLFIPLFITFQLHAQSDFIVVGDTVGVVYSNIDPDSSVQVFSYYQVHYDGQYDFLLDLNNDNIADYQIELYSSGGLGGAQITTKIYGIDTSNKIASMVDTSYCFPWDSVPVFRLAKSLSVGDSITAQNQVWKSYVFLDWNSWFMAYGQCTKGAWTDKQVHYVGFMMPNSGDTILGWLRLQILNSTFYNDDSLIFFDYAATKGFPYVNPVHPHDSTETDSTDSLQSGLKVFFNSTTDGIQINCDEASRYDLCDMTGTLVKSGYLGKGLNTIPVKDIASGCYIVRVNATATKIAIVKR